MNVSFVDFFMVGCGGFVGSILRYLLTFIRFPCGAMWLATGTANLLGSFLLGVIVGALSIHVKIPPPWVLFLKVGVCGGFTTFSTYILEVHSFAVAGQFYSACGYAVISLVLGFVALCVGFRLGACF